MGYSRQNHCIKSNILVLRSAFSAGPSPLRVRVLDLGAPKGAFGFPAAPRGSDPPCFTMFIAVTAIDL